MSWKTDDSGHGKRRNAFHDIFVLIVALLLSAFSPLHAFGKTVLRIYEWKTGTVHVEVPVEAGNRLFFGWIHSLEKIPWNEYFHVDEKNNLILDAITFPAFGAGIPENKGQVCYVKDGIIHMEGIGQVFEELHWLNSHTATGDISLDGVLVTRGSELPQHTRLRLVIEQE